MCLMLPTVGAACHQLVCLHTLLRSFLWCSQLLPPPSTLLCSFPGWPNSSWRSAFRPQFPWPLSLSLLLTPRVSFVDKTLTTLFPCSYPSVLCGYSWWKLSTHYYGLLDSMGRLQPLPSSRCHSWWLTPFQGLDSAPLLPAGFAWPLCWLVNPCSWLAPSSSEVSWVWNLHSVPSSLHPLTCSCRSPLRCHCLQR